MIILGIDPGLRTTGWGVISDTKGKLGFVDCGTIAVAPDASLCDRLHQIFVATRTVALKFAPDECAVEETIVNMNMRTSLHLAHARAAVMCGLRDACAVPVAEYSPSQIKRFVQGTGDAKKGKVLSAVSLILRTTSVAQLDASDALAAAITHALQPKSSVLKLPVGSRLRMKGGRLIARAA